MFIFALMNNKRGLVKCRPCYTRQKGRDYPADAKMVSNTGHFIENFFNIILIEIWWYYMNNNNPKTYTYANKTEIYTK